MDAPETKIREKTLPLDGVRVLEFTHTIMGPACGMTLADLGADVIKIEPAMAGDPTRRLKGFGSGFFGFFNRNKRSLAIDLKRPEGVEAALRMIQGADVLIENFAPGTMERLRLGYDDLRKQNPRLIYCSLKGFLSGPYENRPALDEVVQMMGGLAYMTGPPGRPLRAGASVIDVMGATYGVIGILLALMERDRSGEGQFVKSGLFESTVFLMGQHLAVAAITKEPIPPMSARVSSWAIYDVFDTADGKQIFLGVISDRQWKRFCAAFNRNEWFDDPRLATNEDRVTQRSWLIPAVAEILRGSTATVVARLAEEAKLPFAPVARPEDLWSDCHLRETEGFVETTLPNGVRTSLPKLPLEMNGARFGLQMDPPMLGQHTAELLASVGYSDDEIDALADGSVIALSRSGRDNCGWANKSTVNPSSSSSDQGRTKKAGEAKTKNN